MRHAIRFGPQGTTAKRRRAPSRVQSLKADEVSATGRRCCSWGLPLLADVTYSRGRVQERAG